MRESVNWSLCVVTDRQLARGRPLEEIVRAAIAGGATMIQLREKTIDTRSFIELGQRLLSITREARVPLIINDRVDVALAIDADGVHVGQEDMPGAIARRLLGPDKLVGITVSNVEEARQAERDGADYLGTNAVFATPTKTDTGRPMGLEGLSQVSEAISTPIVGIGGVNADNAAYVIRAGAAGVAVVSAVVAADDVEAAARQLRSVVDAALGERRPRPGR
jgi:thiamine-phosphate pyrophosphorylase